MDQIKIFAGFPSCPDDAFVSSLTFRIVIYILIACITYLIAKKVLANKNPAGIFLIPVVFAGVSWIAFYLYALLQLFTLGLCGGAPLLFPVDQLDIASIHPTWISFYIALPFLVGLICIYTGLLYRKKPSKKSKNTFVLSVLSFVLLVVILIGWPFIQNFYDLHLYSYFHN